VWCLPSLPDVFAALGKATDSGSEAEDDWTVCRMFLRHSAKLLILVAKLEMIGL